VNASRGSTFVVVDLDGVVADTRHRLHWLDTRPKQWSQFFAAAVDDPVLPEGRAAVELAAQAHEIVYLTGRPANYREETAAWLAQHALPGGQLVMRIARDHRPARLMKLAELRRLQGRGEIVMVIDDDEAVVRAIEQAGIPVTHAQWMPEPTRQARARTAAPKTPGT
jgi:hypothetical protein